MPVTLKKEVIIEAPVGSVWQALTDPDMIRRYFFGVELDGSFKEGNIINYKGEWQGKDYKAKAKVLEVKDQKLLRYSYWSDMSGIPDRPENYHLVTYELRPHKEHTHLFLTEQNLGTEQMKNGSSKLWDQVFDNLKHLLEKETA